MFSFALIVQGFSGLDIKVGLGCQASKVKMMYEWNLRFIHTKY